MVNTPAITSPANGAVLPGTATTVKGTITAGGNGPPTAIVVNGHNASITKAGATTATYSVTYA